MFGVEKQRKCTYDFLVLHGLDEGNTLNGSHRFCGDTLINEGIPLYSPVGFVGAFFSDSTHNDQGFAFEYTVVSGIPQIMSDTQHPISHMPTPRREHPPAFLDVQEMPDLLKPGVRVTRGRDWMDGDKDGGVLGQGTVLSLVQYGMVQVRWVGTGAEGSYRFGYQNKYDLTIAKASCGGVLVGDNVVLHYEDNKIPKSGCTWTIRTGNYQAVRIIQLKDNLEETAASVRIIEAATLYDEAVAAKFSNTFWDWINLVFVRGTVFKNPIFVHLTPGGSTTTTPTKMIMTFTGVGSATYNADVYFSHHHFDSHVGHIDIDTTGKNSGYQQQLNTFAIHPNEVGGRVSLSETPPLGRHHHCSEFMKLYDVGNDTLGCLQRFLGSECPEVPGCQVGVFKSDRGMLGVLRSKLANGANGFDYMTTARRGTRIQPSSFPTEFQHPIHIIGSDRIGYQSGLSGEQTAPLLSPGVQVVRASGNWSWGVQDGTPAEEGVISSNLVDGWIGVRWKNGNEFSYRMGHRGIYDLALPNTGSPKCGGVLVGKNGVVYYKSPPGTRDFGCTWTLRADSYEQLQVQVVADNLRDTGARLRVTSMLGRDNTDDHEDGRDEEKESSNSGSMTYRGPVVFVDLNVPKGEFTTQTTFLLSYSGQGDPDAYKNITFTHVHLEDASGGVRHNNGYGENEIVTFVIHPEGRNKNVTLVNTFFDLEPHPNCTKDFLLLSGVRDDFSGETRLCGTLEEDNGNEQVYQVGIAGVFVSNNAKNGKGFSFDYFVAD